MNHQIIKAYDWHHKNKSFIDVFGNNFTVLNQEKEIYLVDNVVFCSFLNIPIVYELIKDQDIIIVASSGDLCIQYDHEYYISANEKRLLSLGKLRDNIVKLYATNLNVYNDQCQCLPFGTWDYSFWHHSVIPNDCPNKWCYANFKLYMSNRLQIWQSIQNNPCITCGNYFTRGVEEDFIKYAQELQQHFFNISPEGNCVDGYRTWETLYLKRYPIVQDTLCNKNFEDLPIIRLNINDFANISESWLYQQLEDIQKTTFNYDKLNQYYWWNQIKKESNKL